MFQTSTPTQYFWYRTTLMVSGDINSPEEFNWKIALALMVAWVLVYMCMIKGIASSGKVNSYELTWNCVMFSAGSIVPDLQNYKLFTLRRLGRKQHNYCHCYQYFYCVIIIIIIIISSSSSSSMVFFLRKVIPVVRVKLIYVESSQ